jgi:hypothetical protein
VQTHIVETEYQNGPHEIRVLRPDDYLASKRYRILYVLPVEPEFGCEFGCPLDILQEMNAHNRYDIIIVQMGFEKEPWYGDNVSDPKIRQASYLKDYIVPFVEKKYSTPGTLEERLLMGFSKSGWGAFSLILAYPDFFGYAAAWDAPILLTDFHFGMKQVYGTLEQLALYRPDLLIPKQKALFQKKARLVLTGETHWGKMIPASGGKSHTAETHRLLEKEGIPHYFNDSMGSEHRWNKLWMEPTLKALMDLTRKHVE